VLLADQNAKAALRLADRALVLESGRVVASGRGDDLAADRGCGPHISVGPAQRSDGQRLVSFWAAEGRGGYANCSCTLPAGGRMSASEQQLRRVIRLIW